MSVNYSCYQLRQNYGKEDTFIVSENESLRDFLFI